MIPGCGMAVTAMLRPTEINTLGKVFQADRRGIVLGDHGARALNDHGTLSPTEEAQTPCSAPAPWESRV